jgi:hypothetical protein
MKSTSKLSDIEVLEESRVTLANAESHPIISKIMEKEGYDSETIAAGKKLLAETKAIYNSNKKGKMVKSTARHNYKSMKSKLKKLFAKHFAKARLIFKRDILAYEQLGLKRFIPKKHVLWVEKAEKFYTEIEADPDLLGKLARLKINEETIADCLAKIEDFQTARAIYLKEIGNTQHSTKTKDAAIAVLKEWMHEFFTVARIALKDQPQLLEVLGKKVKS